MRLIILSDSRNSLIHMNTGLYIHIPFCRRKCLYCDFYSLPFIDESGYIFVEALKNEITLISRKSPWSELRFSTLYIGGGTPTVLGADQLVEIIGTCFHHFTFESDVECTVEANPETVDAEKLQSLLRAGVNRLSLGFQSFNDDELKRLGRSHSVSRAIEAYDTARTAGFQNLGIDLIFAIPGQTLESWKETLKKASDLNPEHISAYNLTVESDTVLAREIAKGTISFPSDDQAAEMYEWTIDYLESCGYEQYEISNFARTGFRSRHNQIYWNHDPYLGLGPSAHSFWENRRSERVNNVDEYIQRVNSGKSTVIHEEYLSNEKLMAEYIFLGLRKHEGVNVKRIQERFGVDIEEIHRQVIRKYVDLKLLEKNEIFLRLTRKGLMVANTVCAEFV